MRVRYGRIAANIHRNPKVRRAGADAREVYIYAVCMNADLEADGVIPASWLEPDIVADDLQRDPEQIAEGLARCETFHLLHRNGENFEIVGWDEEWRPKSSTERVRKFRERKKRDSSDLPADETLHVTPDVTGNAETQKRREEKRSEERSISCRDSHDHTGSSSGSVPSESKPKPKNPRKIGPETNHVREATERFIEAFNGMFERRVGAKGWEDSVKKCLAKGYTEADLRAVAWWAGEEWGGDEEMRKRVSPKTLLKFQSAQGFRTFPEYLALAGEKWREMRNDETPPWERVNGGANG